VQGPLCDKVNNSLGFISLRTSYQLWSNYPKGWLVLGLLGDEENNCIGPISQMENSFGVIIPSVG